MGKVMVIGCGGVAGVAIRNAVRTAGYSTRSVLQAGRCKMRCLKAELEGKTKTRITTAQVDAGNVAELTALIEREKPQVVLNLALPYQDLTIMEACLATGTHYVDTANYEPEDTAKFEYKWQWAYQQKFKDAGLMALLGSGFDPGVTNVFAAYARSTCSTRSTSSTSSTATRAITGSPSPRTSTRKSTSAK